jgi:hypothetical protein
VWCFSFLGVNSPTALPSRAIYHQQTNPPPSRPIFYQSGAKKCGHIGEKGVRESESRKYANMR